jgi:predicted nuclease with TOPRIM domain
MWGFRRVNSIEYEKLSKRIVELSSICEELQNKFKILETNYNDLRGKFNRKLSGIKKEEANGEELGQEETKTINNPVILPYDGTFSKYR